MPEAQEQFQKGVDAVIEAVMFENWLRFYFIEEGEELALRLPQKSLERIRDLYPSLYPLAEELNDHKVDFETSRSAVLRHIAEKIEGHAIPQGEAQKILQNGLFQRRLQLFHVWEQLHEDQLDQGLMEFGAWKSLFAKWLKTPGAGELAKKIGDPAG